MPKNLDIKKVLVIGSGPIIIGQAAEFDYAGTQACRALREEGIHVVLINSNPATIMTDRDIADTVYIEPLTREVIERIILIEKPDSILPTVGGQTGLNLAMELAENDFLEKNHVSLLGTNVDSIKKAEDRELFKKTMQHIHQPVIESVIACNVIDAMNFAGCVGYPLIVRPAYTLGGTGGGIVTNKDELQRITADGIRLSRVGQVLVERSVAGWKEIEYEVLRDRKGNCITICNMENMDPVGIHTGDSIVVAPSQTLRDQEYQMLRSASIHIINTLEIEGGCNVQYALDPQSMQYYVIEVNPRVSRSSALASKATGYPIAMVSSKIAIGYGLDEIINGVTGKTYACFEPTLDYIVVKIPRWPFDKFTKAEKTLGTRMKATGEVMAIGSNFEAAFLKAIRSLELGRDSLSYTAMQTRLDQEILDDLSIQDDTRVFVMAEAIRRGISLQIIHDKTGIDVWFLDKILNIVTMEEKIKFAGKNALNKSTLTTAKKMGFADTAIALWTGCNEIEIRDLRKKLAILPVYKMVDTCSAEFDAISPYYYSTYEMENEATYTGKKTVVVLGSGPIRIGQGIEFDYCSVHCIWALKKAGYYTVIINNNPETVSTDFDTSDRLYFEPLTAEEVWNILDIEKPMGVIVQFGGQTAIKLTKAVSDMGYMILGTQPKYIDMAEDRKEFDDLLSLLDIKRPKGRTVCTEEEAVAVAQELGYPVLVRPSYVLGGQGMEIAYEEENIREYMKIIHLTHQEHPILIDKYLVGKEIEVDAVCDEEDILIPGIMEHIERAGVHSGDSISVYPTKTVSVSLKKKIVEYTKQLSMALHIKGLINIQFIVYDNDLYVIEVNPRSSRTIPFISKVTDIPMVELATRAILGEKIKDLGYGVGIVPDKNITAVKVPVFSFEKLPDVEISLGPEMKSTGEVLGIARDDAEAFIKGLLGSGLKIPKEGAVLMTVANIDKQELIPIAESFQKLGFKIFATSGTAHLLNSHYIAANVVGKINQKSPNLLDLMMSGVITFVINTPTKGRIPAREGFKIRRKAIEHSIPCFTSLDTARMFARSMQQMKDTNYDLKPISLGEID